MNQRGFWCLGHVSDVELQAALRGLLSMGARTEARIVAHLAEVDARKLHLVVGASSLFDYCLSRLGLSNNEAFHRITAARLGRRFPVIFELLEKRDVHLTAVCLLRDYLTTENHAELLREVSHKTKFEIEELLARRFPRPDAPSRLRKVAEFEPLSEGRYCLQLNASAELKRKLELARDLMSHANRSGDLAVVVERGLDVLIERLLARRFAEAKSRRPRPALAGTDAADAAAGVPGGASGGCDDSAAKEESLNETSTEDATKARFEKDLPKKGRAHVRHDVRRAVVARDGQRCAFVGSDGQRCGAQAFLQFHHRRAWAVGGADTSDNLTLMCRAHNRLLADRELGAERVARAIQLSRTRD